MPQQSVIDMQGEDVTQRIGDGLRPWKESLFALKEEALTPGEDQVCSVEQPQYLTSVFRCPACSASNLSGKSHHAPAIQENVSTVRKLRTDGQLP